ncbi:MAG: GTP-binding protein [Candidatus Thermoplasmatota archaeon]
MPPKINVVYKVVLLGNGLAGKTSLVNQYVNKTFSDTYIRTVGVNVKTKNIELKLRGKEFCVSLQIWDIGGQVSYQLLMDYLTHTNGAILVCDITTPTSIDFLDIWLNAALARGEFLKNIGIKSMPIIVAGNKYDLVVDEKMNILSDYEDTLEFLKATIKENIESSFPMKVEIPYFYTSAKTGYNVKEVFEELAKILIDTYYFKEIRARKAIPADVYIKKIGETEENVATVVSGLLSERETKRKTIPKLTYELVLKSISSLPRGLPATLSNIPIDELIEKIVYGEYALTDDNEVVVKIGDRLYYGDPEDLITYLQPYRKALMYEELPKGMLRQSLLGLHH